MDAIRTSLCDVLRGGPIDLADADPDDVLDSARHEGLHLLVAQQLRGHETAGCPAGLRASFEGLLRAELARELVLRRALVDLIATLDAAGVQALLFKGAALAFTHYRHPVLRPRVDTDVLVRSSDVRQAVRVLERVDYQSSLCVTRELVESGAASDRIEQYLVSTQIPFARFDQYGLPHAVDLHWKTSIPLVFANMLPFDELAAGSVPIEALGGAARSIHPIHALAIACVHRVAHHHGDSRLIWVYDIHLLAEALGPDEGAFVRLVREKQMCAICHEALAAAHQCFGTTLPSGLLDTLRDAAARVREPSAIYLRSDLRRVDVLLSDLSSLERWRDRLRLLREHTCPPASYVQKAYGVPIAALVPALYLWRVIEGSWSWFRAGGLAHR